MRKLAIILLGSATLAQPGVAATRMEAASAAQASEAVRECIAITSPKWIDLAKLKQDGWQIATKTGRQGLMQIRGVYKKKDSEAYIVAGRDELREKRCMVIARLDATSSYHPMAAQIATDLGSQPSQDNFTYSWTSGAATVVMTPKGDRESPTAEFTISAREDETQ
ncbi:MAG: hypothetical protein IE933_10870 [Sphingomonadales bacterium]|nr:hypothetical protein [Sphingomonadales bacterium]MBD3773828.1 hypothetical protein [Paracoccaceae bacterium]